MARWILGFLLFAACTCSQAAPVILIVGDSLSAGFGISQEQSWPALLGKRLAREGFPYTVANISISGETTSGGLARLAPALKQHQPEIVIVALGANDGLRGLALEQMRGNLAMMIRQAQAAHAQTLLLGMRLPPNYGADYAQKFQEVYRELAQQYKSVLLPFMLEGFADQRAAFQNDGLHPTAAAQAMLLDNVWRPLRPMLRKQ
ncbi:MAG: arylesterase [Betaproteobacteria bacterium]|nr:arylesterase [Betaproteobacteria bacterium]